MKPTDPMRVLLDELLRELKPHVHELRAKGWPAEVTVNAAAEHEDHVFEVKMTVRLGHSMPVPVEARER